MESSIVAFVINWNRWQQTVSCLESILTSVRTPDWILVLDNGSEDDSFAMLCRWAGGSVEAPQATTGLRRLADCELLNWWPGSTSKSWIEECIVNESKKLVIVRASCNLGFATGCNVGAEFTIRTHQDVMWLVNNDLIVPQRALCGLLESRERSEAEVVGSLVCSEADGEVEFARGAIPGDIAWPARTRKTVDVALDREEWPSDWVTFASAIVDSRVMRERIEQAGYFLNNDLFMYVEDLEFGWYCKDRGIKVVVSASGMVKHFGSSSSGGRGADRVYYYITRNRIIVARLWMSRRLFRAYAVYYVISRVMMQSYLFVKTRGKSRSTAAVVMEGLYDGFRQRKGKWHGH